MENSNHDQDKKFLPIYDAYVKEIYQYVYLRLGMDPARAEDLTQEIFVSVYQGLSGYKGLSTIRTWIYRITKNKLNDFYRRQYKDKWEPLELDSLPEDSQIDLTEDVQQLVLQTFEHDQVRQCLNTLPKQYKFILILKYIDEKRIREIAFLLNKSPKATESLLKRARDAFIKTYEQQIKKEDA